MGETHSLCWAGRDKMKLQLHSQTGKFKTPFSTVCLLEPNRPAEKQRESSSLMKVKIITTKQLSSSTSPQDFREQQLLINVKNGSFFNTGPQERFPGIRRMKKRCSLREDVSLVANTQGAGESLHFS